MTPVNLCRDCTYCIPQADLPAHDALARARCALSTTTEFLVTGENMSREFCSVFRARSGACGPEGKFFQRREQIEVTAYKIAATFAPPTQAKTAMP